VEHHAGLEASDASPGQGSTWQLGDAIVTTLATAMGAAFAEVVVLDACPPNAAPSQNVQAIIVPELLSAESPTRSTWSKSAADFPLPYALVELRMTLRSTKGTSTVSWDVSGAAAVDFRRLPNGEEDVARALSAALLDACARFIADLYLNPDVSTWLMALGVTNEVLE
jgi:hypothetical protein